MHRTSVSYLTTPACMIKRIRETIRAGKGHPLLRPSAGSSGAPQRPTTACNYGRRATHSAALTRIRDASRRVAGAVIDGEAIVLRVDILRGAALAPG